MFFIPGTQLMKNFFWQNNVQGYVFNNFNEDVENYSDLYEMLDNLSVCGENLIVVDNLEPKDIKEIEEFRSEAVNKVKQFQKDERSVTLTVIFLVTIPNYNNVQKTEYKPNLEAVSDIEDIDTVVFETFGELEILSCIKQVIAKESLDINDDGIKGILNSIDPQSGCKKVDVKTAVYKLF